MNITKSEVEKYLSQVGDDWESIDPDDVEWGKYGGYSILLAFVEPGYRADDGNAEVHYEWAGSNEEAGEEYVSSYDPGDSTFWCTVRTWRRVVGFSDNGEVVHGTTEKHGEEYAVDPDVPECEDGEDHDWQSPYEVLGGCKENPGVWGNGGGVISKNVCAHCGRYRVVDTWAQNPENGTQGLTSVEYREPDEYSMDWVNGSEDDDE